MFNGDRGLYVSVGSADAAMTIEIQAREAGLEAGVDRVGPKNFMVRIFGFPRQKA